MKLKTVMWTSTVGLLVALSFATRPAAQEPVATEHDKARALRYSVADVGSLTPNFVTESGLLAGLTTDSDGTQHAYLSFNRSGADIAKPGLGGPNSGAFGVNERGEVDGQAETSTLDPNGEDFCGYGTGFTCVPFLWRDGVMTQLQLLGGNNGTVGVINSRGEVAGIAENGTTPDAECVFPQLLDFQAVIWGPRPGEIRKLDPLPGDSVGMALGINDKGQTVGGSGRCGNTVLPPMAHAAHAVLWERDGSVHDLGNLGGTAINMALSINNHGQVAGASQLSGGSTRHAFLWTRETGMQDLGTLPGDARSFGSAISDEGEVVGASRGADGPRAFIWKDGVMHDLNDPLITPDSPLFLLLATGINSKGEVVGFGVTSAGEVHGFLATPSNGDRP